MQSILREPSWLQIFSNDAMTISIDLANIKRQGQLVTLWQRANYSNLRMFNGTGVLYRSALWQQTVDCKLELEGYAFNVLFSGGNGEGETVVSGPLRMQPAPIVPGSIGDAIKKLVCGSSGSTSDVSETPNFLKPIDPKAHDRQRP